MPRTVADKVMRKSVTLPVQLWERVSNVRYGDRIASEAEALRRLIEEALAARETEKHDEGEHQHHASA